MSSQYESVAQIQAERAEWLNYWDSERMQAIQAFDRRIEVAKRREFEERKRIQEVRENRDHYWLKMAGMWAKKFENEQVHNQTGATPNLRADSGIQAPVAAFSQAPSQPVTDSESQVRPWSDSNKCRNCRESNLRCAPQMG